MGGGTAGPRACTAGAASSQPRYTLRMQRSANMERAHSIIMRWTHLAFLHWRVPAELVQASLPTGLEVDTFDNSAWIGLVPFAMPIIRPRYWPPGITLPRVTEFRECNVRTYATLNGTKGVWFYSLDAGSPLACWAARTFWQLPYYRAKIRVMRADDTISYTVQRRHKTYRGGGPMMRARWTIGDRLPPSKPGSLEHFLTERYWLFAQRRNGRLERGRVSHPQWPLRSATLLDLEDELVASAGFGALDHMPIVHAADPIDVLGCTLEPT